MSAQNQTRVWFRPHPHPEGLKQATITTQQKCLQYYWANIDPGRLRKERFIGLQEEGVENSVNYGNKTLEEMTI